MTNRSKDRVNGLDYLRSQPDAELLMQMLGLAGPEFAPCPGNANWYRKNRCRCEACTRAWALRRARLRAEKRQAAA